MRNYLILAAAALAVAAWLGKSTKPANPFSIAGQACKVQP